MHAEMIEVNYFIFYVLCFAGCVVNLTCTENETFINEYVEYIGNRSQAALAYELPTDARIYQAADTTLQGMNIRRQKRNYDKFVTNYYSISI